MCMLSYDRCRAVIFTELGPYTPPSGNGWSYLPDQLVLSVEQQAAIRVRVVPQARNQAARFL